MPNPNGHQPTPPTECVTVREYLPFYVAGTLNAVDGAMVRAHLASCADCRAWVSAWESVAVAVRAEAEMRVGASTPPPLMMHFEPQRRRGHRELMTSYSGIYDPSLNNTLYGKNTRKTARRYGLMTGLVAMCAALVLISIQIVGRVMPLGQYAAPNPTAQMMTIFDTLQPITPENADQLQIINHFGRGTVRDIDWSPDGTTLAIASTTGVYLYTPDAEPPETDSDSPYVTQKLGESTAKITALDYSPDGQTLAVVVDAQVELWDAATGEVIETFPDTLDALDVEFSPDGARLMKTVCTEIIYKSEDNCDDHYSLRIFRLDTPTIYGGAPGLTRGTATFHPDGDGFAYAIWRDEIKASIIVHADLWQTESSSYMLENQDVREIRFSPDGTRLGVLGSAFSDTLRTNNKTTITIFDITDSLTLEEPLTTIQVELYNYGFEFSADGESVYMISQELQHTPTNLRATVMGWSYTFNLHDLDSLEQRAIPLPEGLSQLSELTFNPVPDSTGFAAYNVSGVVSVWELADETIVPVGSVSDFMYLPDHSVFAPSTTQQPFLAFQNANQIEIWDYRSGQRVDQIDTREPFILSYRTPAFNQDGVLMFSLPPQATGQTLIGVWDAESGFATRVITDTPAELRELDFTEDGRTVMVGSDRGYAVGIWREGANGTFTFTDLDGIGDFYNPRGGSFSRDGAILSFSSCIPPNPSMDCPGRIGFSLYNTLTGERLLEFIAGLSLPFGANLTQHIDDDHALVAITGCADSSGDLDERPNFTNQECYGSRLTAWDVSGVLAGTADQPRELFALDSDLEHIGPIAISPDAQLIVARTEADTLSVISITTADASATESGEIVATIPFSEHSATVTFNDTGTLLAVGGEGTITLYGVTAEE